ncbi:MAG: redoxin domain-containing protein [Candidatus Methanomethylophilaceae archaeon]|nr:redoxin domain-containing protein [Candidatus Methanomethylophilaceae archaeon]
MQFPDFVLKDENGESLDSSFLKGMRMIVCFVPDLEKESVDQLCEFDSIYQKVMIRNIVTLMVVKAECPDLRAVMDKYSIRVKLLSDVDESLVKACGLEGRSTVMVSKEGDIVSTWSSVRPAGHADAVYEKVKSLFK